jgi:hypothetical protein
MAKSQKHSNREAKKPKQIKIAAPLASDGLLAKASLSSLPSNKKRG